MDGRGQVVSGVFLTLYCVSNITACLLRTRWGHPVPCVNISMFFGSKHPIFHNLCSISQKMTCRGNTAVQVLTKQHVSVSTHSSQVLLDRWREPVCLSAQTTARPFSPDSRRFWFCLVNKSHFFLQIGPQVCRPLHMLHNPTHSFTLDIKFRVCSKKSSTTSQKFTPSLPAPRGFQIKMSSARLSRVIIKSWCHRNFWLPPKKCDSTELSPTDRSSVYTQTDSSCRLGTWMCTVFMGCSMNVKCRKLMLQSVDYCNVRVSPG